MKQKYLPAYPIAFPVAPESPLGKPGFRVHFGLQARLVLAAELAGVAWERIAWRCIGQGPEDRRAFSKDNELLARSALELADELLKQNGQDFQNDEAPIVGKGNGGD